MEEDLEVVGVGGVVGVDGVSGVVGVVGVGGVGSVGGVVGVVGVGGVGGLTVIDGTVVGVCMVNLDGVVKKPGAYLSVDIAADVTKYNEVSSVV